MEKQSNKFIIPFSKIILSMQQMDLKTYSFVGMGLSNFLYLKMDFHFFSFFLEWFYNFSKSTSGVFSLS